MEPNAGRTSKNTYVRHSLSFAGFENDARSGKVRLWFIIMLLKSFSLVKFLQTMETTYNQSRAYSIAASSMIIENQVNGPSLGQFCPYILPGRAAEHVYNRTFK